MRTIFAGSGDIALPALRWLAARCGDGLVAAICQPDKPAGRKQILTPPPVKTAAEKCGIAVRQPTRLRELADDVAQLQPDLIVVMAYGRILPREVLEFPRRGCLNLHASLLPRHRGASPVQAAILAGDRTSGLTLMHMAEELDTGDIALQESIDLTPDETGGSLHDRLAALAPVVLERAWPSIEAGALPRIPQDHAQATYSGKLRRADGAIDWSEPAEAIARRIRAFDPWPGTSTILPDGSALKVFPPVDVSPESTGCPAAGTVVSADPDDFRVACGEGSLRISDVQPAGGRRMIAREFLAGHRIAAGAPFG